MTSRRAPLILAIFLLPLGAGLAIAQQPERVLHEYFNPPQDISKLRRDARSGASAEPPRVSSRTPGEAPPLTLDVRKDEPVMGQAGPMSSLPMQNPQGGLDPSTATNKLDSDTDRVDELNYFSSFDPSVIPYKRGVAQNEVKIAGGDYAFVVSPGRLREVTVERRASPAGEEDIFWGTFLLKSQAGQRTPIPSVAPNQDILEVLTEPATPLTIERDDADNHYVTAPTSGLVRINMKIAAPRSYFDAEFGEVAWGELDRSELTQLPAALVPVARQVALDIGVNKRTMSPRSALLALIEHYRDFEGQPFPDELRGDDVYRSISMNQIGVCRHRSFAFVITASALGIPSRYVYNEAHAFVEIKWPQLGWRRVDLGGAAQDVLMRAAEEQRRVHDGGANDSLPSPPAYQEELQRLAEQEDARRDNAVSGGPPGEIEGGGDNAGFDAGDGPQSSAAGRDDAGSEQREPGEELADSPFAPDERTETFARIEGVSPAELRRGKAFTIRGRLYTGTAQGAVSQRTLRILITSPTASHPGGKLVGKVETDLAGRFESSLTLPTDLPIGRWALRAVFDGDDTFQPSVSP